METRENSPRKKRGLRSMAKKFLFALGIYVGSLAIDKHFTHFIWSNDQNGISRSVSVLNDGDNYSTPKVQNSDRIYRFRVGPVVLEEYKLIFLTIPKVASSEWKRMFMRMMNHPKWCIEKGLKAHEPSVNHLRYLSTYSKEKATHMMTSPEWTRAVFVREPKKRILSAFLDKAVDTNYFASQCCSRINNKEVAAQCRNCRALRGEAYEKCARTPENFKNFLDIVSNKYCRDVHWEPQAFKIDPKWWPYFNFIGYQENLHEDAKLLLTGLFSSKDPSGPSAWDRFGTTGWGKNKGCHNEPSQFLKKNSSHHKTGTDDSMAYYYTPETEKLVEEHWRSEWNINGVNFPKIKLFEETS